MSIYLSKILKEFFYHPGCLIHVLLRPIFKQPCRYALSANKIPQTELCTEILRSYIFTSMLNAWKHYNQ